MSGEVKYGTMVETTYQVCPSGCGSDLYLNGVDERMHCAQCGAKARTVRKPMFTKRRVDGESQRRRATSGQ